MALLSKRSEQVGGYTVRQNVIKSTVHSGNDYVCSVTPTGKHGQKNVPHCTDHDIPGKTIRHRAENCPLDGSEHCGHKNKFFKW